MAASVGLTLFPSAEPYLQTSPASGPLASDSQKILAPDEALSNPASSNSERMTDPGSSMDEGGLPNPRIDSSLSQLIARLESGGSSAAADFAAERGLHLTDSGVKVVLESSTSTTETEALVTAAGGRTEATHGNMVQALIPVDSLEKIAASPGVSLATGPARTAHHQRGVGVIGATPGRTVATPE